jgi:hypothetical protein
VRIEEAALGRFAAELAASRPPAASPDPARASGAALAYTITLNAINFGSGWFPVLRKRPGCSGYLTVAHALRERFEAEGPWSAAELSRLGEPECAAVFGQEANAEAAPLMALFAGALRDLGAFLAGWGGRFEGPVEEAGGSAERLVRLLARMPLYADVSRYGDLEVPFYKRAQITVSDLAESCGGAGWGSFRDLDSLTMFADNLVPHTLRMAGVLRYDEALASRIERGELLESGSAEEVEIRALGLHAVERLVAALRLQRAPTTAHALDHVLWDRGQSPTVKAVPRHRTRCTFY